MELDPAAALLRSLALVAALAAPASAAALEPGDAVEDLELPTLAGGKAHLVEGGVVNVLVFVRPGHGHCQDTLRDFTNREGRPAGTRWVAVVPGDSSPAETRALLAGTGIRMPVLLDPGDVVYGRLRLKLHPTVVVVDRQGRLAAVEPFREINYGDRLEARLRFTLGEITGAQLAEAIDPPLAETHSDRGLARSNLRFAEQLLELGQLDQALTAVQRGLSVEPSARAYLLEGQILARQGKCGEATRAFDFALRLEPANADAATGKSRCQKERRAAP